MALTNAEKQAMHRVKQSATLESLTASVIEFSRKNEELHAQLAAAAEKNHALELKLAKLTLELKLAKMSRAK